MFAKKVFDLSYTLKSVRTYKKYIRQVKHNPGLDKRLKLFKAEQPEIANLEVEEESLENLEYDLNNSKSMIDSHVRENSNIKKKILFKQIERKHFTTRKLPNMLLWAEKEQIRLLSQNDPDLWTPEKLSECFPATPEIIYKLLKAQWKPKSSERIKAHDKTVCDNWNAFEMGKLIIPDYLARHLKHFTNRKTVVKTKDEFLPEVLESRREGEFINLVRNYKNQKKPLQDRDSSDTIPPLKSIHNDTFLLRKQPRKVFEECTLEEMNRKISLGQIKDDSSSSLLARDNYEPNSVQGYLNESTIHSGKLDDNGTDIEIENSEGSSTSNFNAKIVMKIKIPKEKWKKGCVFKINNCFYSDDGEFLYRI